MIIILFLLMKYKKEEKDCLRGNDLKRKLIINVVFYIIFYSIFIYKCLIVYYRMMLKKKIFGEKFLGYCLEKLLLYI